MSTHTSEPKCDRCQTPMERYAVPGTGGKEQSWRLACPCQHSATPDVARTSNSLVDRFDRGCDSRPLLEEADREIERLRAHRNVCVQYLRLGAEQIRSADQRLSPYFMDQAKLLRIAVILDSAAKNAMADEPPAHETSDDLLYRIHRELARGHSSAALAVLAAALEHRALPACTACDVVTLAHNAQKAIPVDPRNCPQCGPHPNDSSEEHTRKAHTLAGLFDDSVSEEV